LGKKRQLKKFYEKQTRFIYKLEETLNLRFLQKKGFKIPKSFTCSLEALEFYKKVGPIILDYLKQELVFYIDEDKTYSVRCSANLKDKSIKSFVGQFQTIFNQKGVDSILNSIEKIWISLGDIKIQDYSKKFSQNPNLNQMCILIQEMVYPEFSGVVFTRNPLTGLNEIIVECVKGSGENLVQVGKTPERWVNKWDAWIECPPVTEKKIKIISKIVKESKKISRKYGEPLNLEWAYDGKKVYWLQLRQITALKNNNLYSNKLLRNFMPGMIKPLVWSVNVPVVNTIWEYIFEVLIGSAAKKIDIHNLAHSFYYRAYFNMNIMGDIFELFGMPRDLLETLLGVDSEGKDKPSFKPSGRTLYYLPRIFVFCMRLYSFSKYIRKFLKSHKKKYDLIKKINIDNLDEKESKEFIEKLIELNTKATFYVVLTEFLNNFYNKRVKDKLIENNIEYEDIGFPFVNKRLKNSDPHSEISRLYEEFNNLKDFEKEDITQIEYEEFLERYADNEFTRDFQKFILKFGFLREIGNDFSKPSWDERPQLMLKMVIDHKEPEVKKAYEERFKIIKKYIFKSRLSKSILKRAIQYLEYKQAVTNLYSYGYDLFRIFFLKIADLLVNKKVLLEKDDIFYLTYDEVKEIIENNEKAKVLRKYITKRKKEMLLYRNLQLPEIIYNDVLPKPILSDISIQELEGVPTSKGFHIGPVKVVKGYRDEKKIQKGDIIAIPYSEVSLTPLFAKAKAVISESGGLLSHFSIVAREYNIPVLVSVKGATLLKNNTLIAVDAYKGKISILKDKYKLDKQYDREIPVLIK